MNQDQDKSKELWVYDIEVYPNLFVANFKNYNTGERKNWVLRDQDKFFDIDSLRKFYLSPKRMFVGFNILSYDHPVMLKILREKSPSTQRIKSLSDSVFSKNIVIDSPNLIDLFKIMHFDNKNKSASLKKVEGVLRWENLEELPYPPNSSISRDQQDRVIEYCWNDVLATERFFEEIKEKVRFHFFAKRKYKLHSHNISEAKIGEGIVAREYEVRTGRKFTGKTIRSKIRIGDVIADYVEFQTPKLQRFLSNLKNLELTVNDDGKFIDNHGSKFEKKITVGANTYKLGSGGIHSIDDWSDYRSTSERILLDKDVKSLYPTLIANLGLYPEHLGVELLEAYKELLATRLLHKSLRYADYLSLLEQREHQMLSEILKISLNSVYGKSKSIYSALYDPKVTIATTINGQLSLLMLIEMTQKFNPISANTDGVLFNASVSDLDSLEKVSEKWEQITNLELEDTNYQRYYAKDVNNYIAILEDGKSKEKGVYCVDKKRGGVIEYHKNHSMRIVPLAIREFLSKDIPIEETISNHKDIYDFCLMFRAKTTEKKGYSQFRIDRPDSTSDLLGQNIRIFASDWRHNNSGKIKKVFADGSSSDLNHQHSFAVFNKAFPVNLDSVDKSFYIKEARKLMFNQLKLF